MLGWALDDLGEGWFYLAMFHNFISHTTSFLHVYMSPHIVDMPYIMSSHLMPTINIANAGFGPKSELGLTNISSSFESGCLTGHHGPRHETIARLRPHSTNNLFRLDLAVLLVRDDQGSRRAGESRRARCT